MGDAQMTFSYSQLRAFSAAIEKLLIEEKEKAFNAGREMNTTKKLEGYAIGYLYPNFKDYENSLVIE